MSEEKLVTYKDLPVLRRILEAVGHSGCGPLVQRLIAAAEADRPTLEDGIYEAPDEDGDYRLVYVRDGRYSKYRLPDGAPLGGGYLLPADTSTWRRIDGPPTVTPKRFEEAARAVSGYSESQWATLSEGIKDCYRARARKVLTASGVEVQP